MEDINKIYGKETLDSFERKASLISRITKSLISSQRIKGVVLRGNPGISKTYTVLKTLEQESKFNTSFKFHKISGRITGTVLYDELSEHRNELVVIDDCDCVFYDINTLNLLKAATDTLPVRTISWAAQNKSTPQFEFNGKILIITNANNFELRKNPHINAFLDRIQYLEIDVTFEEKIAKMLDIVKHDSKWIKCQEVGRSCIQYILKPANVEKFKEKNISLRFLEKLAGIRELAMNEDGQLDEDMFKSMVDSDLNSKNI